MLASVSVITPASDTRRRADKKRSHRTRSGPSSRPTRSTTTQHSHSKRAVGSADSCERCRHRAERRAARKRSASRSAARSSRSSASRDRSEPKRKNRHGSKKSDKSRARRPNKSAAPPTSHAPSGSSRKIDMWKIDGDGTPTKTRVRNPKSCLRGTAKRRNTREPNRRVHFAKFGDVYYI